MSILQIDNEEILRDINSKEVIIKDSVIPKPITIKCDKAFLSNISVESFNNITFLSIKYLTLRNITESIIDFIPIKSLISLTVVDSSFIIDLIPFTNLRILKIIDCSYDVFNNTPSLEKLSIEGKIMQTTIDSMFNSDNNVSKLKIKNTINEPLNLGLVRNISRLKIIDTFIDYIIFDPSIIKLKLSNCYINNLLITDKLNIRDIIIENIENIYQLLINDRTKNIEFKDINVDLHMLIKTSVESLKLNRCNIIYGISFNDLKVLSIIKCNYEDNILSNNIEDLNIEESSVEDMSKIMLLKKLKFLRLPYNKIKEIPEVIRCKGLKLFNLSGNKITQVPKNISVLQELDVLNLSDNYELKYISPEIKNLNITELYIDNCHNLSISEDIKKWIEKKFNITHIQSHNINKHSWLFFVKYTNINNKYRNISNYIMNNSTYDISDKFIVYKMLDISLISKLNNVKDIESIYSYFSVNISSEYTDFIKDKKELYKIFNTPSIYNSEKIFNVMMQLILLPTPIHKYIFLSNDYNRKQYSIRGDDFIEEFKKHAKDNINKIISNKEYEPIIKINIINNMVYFSYN